MKPNFILLAFCLLVFFFQSASAKEREVKGKVTTFKTIPLHKASIVYKSMNGEILTDENGCFSFTCDESEKLTIDAQGFFSEKVKLKDVAEGDSLKIDLRFKKGKKNFEIATGYGHISEKQLSYAIQHLEAGPDYSAYSSILDALQGRVSGISIGHNSITIRGNATLNSGPTPALLVVDGSSVEFSIFVNIPPTQIKSIDVLKGSSASARYGSQGMGGVIVVKTKTEN